MLKIRTYTDLLHSIDERYCRKVCSVDVNEIVCCEPSHEFGLESMRAVAVSAGVVDGAFKGDVIESGFPHWTVPTLGFHLSIEDLVSPQLSRVSTSETPLDRLVQV